MRKYSREQIQETTDASPQPPPLAAEGERGLTPKRRKILEETMHRHDKSLKMLANM